MPRQMSAVNLLVNSFLPEDLRDDQRVYDKKGMDKLMTEIARTRPELYSPIAQKLGDIGRHQAYHRGETFNLEDFRPVHDRQPAFDELDRREAEIRQRVADPQELQAELGSLYGEFSDRIGRETNAAALGRRNNIALTVLTGARGKEAQLRDLVSTPGFYPDGRGGIVPWFIRRSFGEGMRPADYLAGTFAARDSVTGSKKATAKGGFLAKTLSRAAITHLITQDDCGTANGIDLPVDEPDIRGRVLQRPEAGFPAGTVIDRRVLARLKAEKVPEVIVRSPLTCGSENGLCSKCFGVKAEGHFPKIGDHVGITASNALGEPLCLGEDTEVRMADWSVKRIKDMVPGDMVMGSDMEGRIRPTRVVNVFHNGPRECVKTKVKKGRGGNSEMIELVSTTAHKVLSYQSSKGFQQAVPTIQPIQMEKFHHCVYLGTGLAEDFGDDVPFADLLGVLIGDGSYTGGMWNGGIGFSCYDDELTAYMEGRLSEHGMRLAHMSKGEYRVSMADCARQRVGVATDQVWHPIKKVLISEGMWGQRSGEKGLPASISNWSNRSISRLIGGLIATDGWVSETKHGGMVGFSSNSKALLQGVKDLLELRFGIYGGALAAKRKKKPDGTCYAPTYELCICGRPDLEELARQVFVPGCKQARLERLAGFTSKVRTPRLARGRYRVKAQTPVGIVDTWDIEVDNETHLFLLANGMVVSNTQQALSMKHVTSGKGQKKEFSGLDYINQFVESPEEFKDRSVVAELPGHVERVEPAPQGGSYVVVGGQRHYVPIDREITSQVGDQVEAGDQLTDGLLDVEDVLKHKGLGAARRYWSDRMSEMGKASSAGMDRRLFEVLARANVDHVQLDDPTEEGFLPDDITRYSSWLHRREIPPDAQAYSPKDAVGKWLEQPVLHHTVGTKITPSMADHLASKGFDRVFASGTEPAFSPKFVRLQQVASTNDDWLASLGGSYLGNQLQQGITRAQDTNIEENIHPVPRLAVGVGYGDRLEETGKF